MNIDLGGNTLTNGYFAGIATGAETVNRVEVDDDDARYSLTTDRVKNGSIVYVVGTSFYYLVSNQEELSSEIGYLGPFSSTGSWEFPFSISFYGANNTAPTQTATSESSLMTRGLVTDEDYYSITCIRDLAYVSVSNNGANSSASNTETGAIGAVNSGAATSGYGKLKLATIVNQNPGTGSCINFTHPMGIALVLSYTAAAAVNGAARIYFGNETPPPPANSNALTGKGFGAELTDNGGFLAFRLFAHNGTTYTAGSWATTTIGISNIYFYMIYLNVRSTGSGTIIGQYELTGGNFSRSFTTIPSITGGPSGAINGEVAVVSVNQSTGTPVAAYIIVYAGKLLIK